ncbi:anaphase promoting complex subunit cdc16 [Sparganum proliferum]
MVDIDLETIRNVVQTCMKVHRHGSALYWADKAVCLSKGAIGDVINLAEAMYFCGQYHRAIAILSNRENVREEIYSRFLIAQCYHKSNEHMEALKILGNLEYFQQTSEKFISNSFITFYPPERPPNVLDKLDKSVENLHLKATASDYLPPGLNSSIALLRGNINEALNNFPAAAHWYKEAFCLDPFCYEAFEKLTKLEVVSVEGWLGLLSFTLLDEKQLLKCELPSAPASTASIVKALYADKIPKLGITELPPELSLFKNNCDVLVHQADRLLSSDHYRRVLKDDPFHPDCLPIHISVLRMLNQSNELFILSNRLVKIYPESAISWFATGSYYLATRKHDLAKRHLRKATQQDRRFGPAWLALGHAYAADSEHDQAIAAYCTAAQIVRCSHIPMMYIGVEYSASNNHILSERFLKYARERNPNDPAILHELGSLAFKSKRYSEALELLKQAYSIALDLSDQVLAPYWEPLLNNLAHVYRELGEYEQALKLHFAALNLVENSPSTLESMGLIYAMTNRFEEAVRAFQTAISFHARLGDVKFASKMLNLCMKQLVKGDNTKQTETPPGRGIVESPPPSAFLPIPLQLPGEEPVLGVPSIKADMDVVYHPTQSGGDKDVSDSVDDDDDVTMEFV